jgi:predicted DCC family thiol-disulfide oxidoreductase YuxK
MKTHGRARRWQPRHVADVADGTILFDGVCILCSFWVQYVIKHDSAARFRFLAIQSEAGRTLAQNLSINPDHPETNVVVIAGTAYFKSDAAIEVMTRLSTTSGLGFLRFIPARLRDIVYDGVARNRYRLFGRRTSCWIPSEDMRQRLFEDT